MDNYTVIWFRRDLRLEDQAALSHALNQSTGPVIPLFIFDSNILDDLTDKKDRRVLFIYNVLSKMRSRLISHGGGMLIKYGDPLTVWKELVEQYKISQVFYNRDYEPYAKSRDQEVTQYLTEKGVDVSSYKDQVVFESEEIRKADGEPYVVYTPYKRKWLDRFHSSETPEFAVDMKTSKWAKIDYGAMPALGKMGFEPETYDFPVNLVDDPLIASYDQHRDYPAVDGTSRLGAHFRFGTISIRKWVKRAATLNSVFLSELIWREFYSQILDCFPHVVGNSFRPKYDHIEWLNDQGDFAAWCNGMTGYPLVDAGMRELNQTGYMHNRVRMVTASFLTKHLLIDWRQGEAYFASRLLDYDLASNNGGWQWAAGCGTDAAPYFRIFNPESQLKKFDGKHEYVRKWVPDLDELTYPAPIVEHKFARERCLRTYKAALST